MVLLSIRALERQPEPGGTAQQGTGIARQRMEWREPVYYDRHREPGQIERKTYDEVAEHVRKGGIAGRRYHSDQGWWGQYNKPVEGERVGLIDAKDLVCELY